MNSTHKSSKHTEQARKREVARLTRENKRLRRALTKEKAESARLRRRLSVLRQQEKADFRRERASLFPHKPQTPAEEQRAMLQTEAVNARRYTSRTYIRYLISTFKGSVAGNLFRRMALYWRRLRVVRTIAAVVVGILATLVVSAVYITLLPFLVFGILGTLVAITVLSRSADRRMKHALEGKHIRVIIPPDEVSFDGNTFLERSAIAMAQEKNTAVIIVSPRFWSCKGLGGQGMFFTVRREANDLYLVRKGYYFILRRRVLDVIDAHLTVIY